MKSSNTAAGQAVSKGVLPPIGGEGSTVGTPRQKVTNATLTKKRISPMPEKVPYADKKPDLLRVLQDTARRKRKITYGELGKLVGIPAQGPWKPVLDEIGRDQVSSGLPDISYLVVASNTGYPSQIEFEDARKPTPEQKRKADQVIGLVHDAYANS